MAAAGVEGISGSARQVSSSLNARVLGEIKVSHELHAQRLRCPHLDVELRTEFRREQEKRRMVLRPLLMGNKLLVNILILMEEVASEVK